MNKKTFYTILFASMSNNQKERAMFKSKFWYELEEMKENIFPKVQKLMTTIAVEDICSWLLTINNKIFS